MTRCPACFQNSYPEVPDITINATTINVDGAEVAWFNEYFTTVSASYNSTSKTIQLAHWPVSAEAVQLSLNGVVQGEAASGDLKNFSVSGDIVTLYFTPLVTDDIHIQFYGYVSTSDTGDDEPVGTMRAYAGAVAPSGWLFMDGVTSHLIASFPALYSHANTNGLLLSSTATNFVLKQAYTQFLIGGVATSVNTIIKA